MKVLGTVIFAHVLVIASLVYFHSPKPKSKPRRPVAVQTYVIQEEKPKIAEQPKPAAVPKPVGKKPAEAKPKPVVEAKPKPKPKPVKKKSGPNRDKLMQMMQQSLASLDHKTVESKITPSKQIGTLASEALSFENAYQDQLIAFLQQALTLPEKGDVKLSLTVNRNGGVKAVSVKQAASERNRKYVEAEIPALLLPAFDTHFKGENAHTFSITLTSS